MADVKWIKITVDVFDDEKILLIESMPDSDSLITIWFKLLCLAGKHNNSGVFMLNEKIKYTDEMLSTIFRRNVNTVRLALSIFEQFGMIEKVNDVITIPNWDKHQNLDKLEAKNQYMKEYMRERRDRQKQLTEGNKDCKSNSKTNSKSNSKSNSKTNVSPLELELELYKQEEDIKTYGDFDFIWSLYPNKKGKGSINKNTIKKLLGEVGHQQLVRCVQRYKKEIVTKNIGAQFIKHGSTFFNSGYVDYLDANYEETKTEVCPYREVD